MIFFLLSWRDAKTDGKQRPTAKELLQHRFVKYARKTSVLTELTERYHDWRIKSPKRESPAGGKKDETIVGTMMSAWEFETVRRDGDMTGKVVHWVCWVFCLVRWRG